MVGSSSSSITNYTGTTAECRNRKWAFESTAGGEVRRYYFHAPRSVHTQSGCALKLNWLASSRLVGCCDSLRDPNTPERATRTNASGCALLIRKRASVLGERQSLLVVNLCRKSQMEKIAIATVYPAECSRLCSSCAWTCVCACVMDSIYSRLLLKCNVGRRNVTRFSKWSMGHGYFMENLFMPNLFLILRKM